MTVDSPSGVQTTIRFEGQVATLVEVGGGVRAYEVDGRAVLEPYAADAMCDGAHGAPLIPWPNRLADGRYRFDGVAQQVPLTEPTKGNAIHGLMRWRSWAAQEKTESAVTMAATLRPSPGYPYALAVRIRYSLGADGLAVTTTVRNIGAGDCPLALRQHPYLSPGDGSLDDCVLKLDAATRVRTDPERQLPVGVEATAGTAYDFRGGRPLRGQVLDDPFTGLGRDADGMTWARLSCPDGRQVQLWADAAYGYLEVFTSDTLPGARRRAGVAVEPMTAPPNAFASGEALIRLAPGQSAEASWGVRLR